jgi:hypothetical protein
MDGVFTATAGPCDRDRRTDRWGAHPVTRVPIDDRFMLQTPFGEIRDPIKGQDFEGVGVTPDIAVPASEALLAAQKVLLQGRVEAGDADARWAMVPIAFAISGQTASASDLDAAVGKYEGRALLRTATGLAYHWRDHFVLALDPIGKDLFAVQGTDDYRFRLVREKGAVSGLERVWKSGKTVTIAVWIEGCWRIDRVETAPSWVALASS